MATREGRDSESTERKAGKVTESDGRDWNRQKCVEIKGNGKMRKCNDGSYKDI